MSFSTNVKKELSEQLSSSRHCQLAELAAFVCSIGIVLTIKEGKYKLIFQTDNIAAARKSFVLIKEAFGISPKVAVKRHFGGSKSKSFRIEVENTEDAARILKALKLIDDGGNYIERTDFVNAMLVKNSCCKKAFIRGIFITSGSVTDPNKPYHFEIVCQNDSKAQQLKDIILTFGIEARVVLRKKHSVLYIKGGELIADMLRIMEASRSVIFLENIRVEKEVRGNVNRVNNCDNANIAKTAQAAVEQSEYIRYIFERNGFAMLPDNLKELAELRLEFPEATIKELGMKLNPPLGKSGVNHRLNKLKDISRTLRENEERENDS